MYCDDLNKDRKTGGEFNLFDHRRGNALAIRKAGSELTCRNSEQSNSHVSNNENENMLLKVFIQQFYFYLDGMAAIHRS